MIEEDAAQIEAVLRESIESLVRASIGPLVDKSRTLVDLTDDAERNHGGLISVALLRAKNELRLELSRWR